MRVCFDKLATDSGFGPCTVCLDAILAASTRKSVAGSWGVKESQYRINLGGGEATVDILTPSSGISLFVYPPHRALGVRPPETTTSMSSTKVPASSLSGSLTTDCLGVRALINLRYIYHSGQAVRQTDLVPNPIQNPGNPFWWRFYKDTRNCGFAPRLQASFGSRGNNHRSSHLRHKQSPRVFSDMSLVAYRCHPSPPSHPYHHS